MVNLAIPTVSLESNSVRLECLTIPHIDGLKKAAKRPEIWAHSSQQGPTFNFETYLADAQIQHQNGTQIVFAVIQKSHNKIVGSTRFYDLAPSDKRLAIGFTWYAPEVWGSVVNPETKLLLLSYVFETLQWNRVEFHVDARNKRSLAALKKLGAQEEGTLRRHKIVQGGFVRDTVMFSIVREEWEGVKMGLMGRLWNDV